MINSNDTQRLERLDSADLARKAVEAASDRQAEDIILLDVRSVCDFTDYLVICSGDNPRQLQSISDEVERIIKLGGVKKYHTEGSADSGWLLIDYGDLIVHIFSKEERETYKLDKLWNEAIQLLRVQ